MYLPIYDKSMSDTLDNRLAHNRIRPRAQRLGDRENVAVKFELVEPHKQPSFPCQTQGESMYTSTGMLRGLERAWGAQGSLHTRPTPPLHLQNLKSASVFSLDTRRTRTHPF